MATVNKDFRVKNGLVVEGTTATVNGSDILTTASTIGSDSLAEGSTNLFFTNARAIAAVGEALSLNDLSDVSGAGLTDASSGDVLTFDGNGWAAASIPAVNSTDDVSEGSTNLYFTDARAISAVISKDNAYFTGSILGTYGDLAVDGGSWVAGAANFGTSITVDSITLDGSNVTISEFTINGADGTISSAGNFTVDSGNSITLDATDAYEGSINLNSNIEGGVYVNGSRVATRDYVDASAIANTDELSEGSTNLYFTDARAISAVISKDNAYFTGSILGTYGDLAVDGGSWVAGAANFGTSITVDGITLDGNEISAASGSLTIDASSGYETSINLNTHVEGGVFVNGSKVATQDFVNFELSALVDSAPGTLDTLNELAAALGDDPNFATTITNLIANQTTDGVAEGSTNLYFTNARAVSAVDGATLGSLTVGQINGSFGALTVSGILQDTTNVAYAKITDVQNAAISDTDQLTEGSTNLYFTDARAVSAITGETIKPDTVHFRAGDLSDSTVHGTKLLNYTVTRSTASVLAIGTLPSHNVAKLLVSVINGVGHTETFEVLVATKSGSSYTTEYANITTDSSFGDFDVDNGVMTFTQSGSELLSIEVYANIIRSDYQDI